MRFHQGWTAAAGGQVDVLTGREHHLGVDVVAVFEAVFRAIVRLVHAGGSLYAEMTLS